MFDYIIIGAGMGGLSAGNFLTKYNKKVLILEKHNIPGGLITSFKRKGTQFNLGIESLYELKEGQTIPQFLKFWGATIKAQKNTGDICCFIDGERYSFRHDKLKDDFIDAFPNNKDDVNLIFDINERMYIEMNSGTEAPKTPYEMNLLEFMKFGITNYIKKPTFMKYGMKDACVVLDKLTQNPVLRSAIYSKGIFPMVYMAYAYRFNVVGKDYYPIGGMQAIPDASVKCFTENGETIKLNTEVSEILMENSKVIGVKIKNGDCYYANTVISNASPHFTYDLLPDSLLQKRKMKKKIKTKEIFPPICALFMCIKSDYDFGNTGCFSFLSTTNYKDSYKNFTPENSPIEMIVYPQNPSDVNKAVVALLPIPYEYHNYWETGAKRERGEAYYKLKNEVMNTVISRLDSSLGNGFKDSLLLSELSTPITFERYTYSKSGSFMGWAIDSKNYGKFLKQKTDVRNLYLCGQWVFPGFGVAGVMASGYYLAKDLLKLDGINLERDYKNYFMLGL
ncbi:phytoene desaturase family protein [Desnuesiella massiliensis]|uniref:phytoene desaturase family protein n=1 Tax=Desnuesiella massiliensis TaxID=1650662 RepID=UPI0006E3E5EE|nr:NAD(P)/FAD-dependent oxidoreductase [Desnuesiella massiliensis]